MCVEQQSLKRTTYLQYTEQFMSVTPQIGLLASGESRSYDAIRGLYFTPQESPQHQ